MKRLKINLSLLAMLVAVTAAVAFKEPAKPAAKNLAVAWFSYNGTGSISSPSSYTKLAGVPSCDGDGMRCAIQGEEDGSTNKPTQAAVNNPLDERFVEQPGK
jgi:hypothetical protein